MYNVLDLLFCTKENLPRDFTFSGFNGSVAPVTIFVRQEIDLSSFYAN